MPDAVITPRWTKGCPKLGPLSVMISTQADTNALVSGAGNLEKASRSPMMSSLYTDPENRFSVLGPMMGAPYAVSLQETILAWGVKRIFFFGWCGSLSPDLHIGDVLLPDSALIDEGTSLHYGGASGGISAPSPKAIDELEKLLTDWELSPRRGTVWTTDAPFRETPEKIDFARSQGALAVDMETSALFTAASFRGAEVAAVLVVSDDLSTLSWKPGFRTPEFRAARKHLCEGFASLCRTP